MVVEHNLISFDTKYNNALDNWHTITDEEVAEFKEYIRNICKIPFETLFIAKASAMVRLIGFCSNNITNKKKFMAVHVKKGQCKIFRGDVDRTCASIISASASPIE